MGSFAQQLTPEDAVAVREYLISRANFLKTHPGALSPFGPRPAENGHANN
jgi:hypothetical protein